MTPFYFRICSLLMIAAAGTAAYADSFHCSFHFDDFPSIVENSSVKHLFDLGGLWHFWPCRFVTYFSFAVNHYFGGYAVFGFHLFNLAVHLAAAALLWRLVLLTFLTPVMKTEKIARHTDCVALFAGLVFALHPLQTEAVTYIVQRAASMAAMFYLASLCFYVQAALIPGGVKAGEGKRAFYAASLFMAVLALFSKEMAVTLPLAVLLYEAAFLRTKEGMNLRRVGPFFAIAATVPLTMFWTGSVNFHQMRLANEMPAPFTSWQYLLTQLRVMVTYVRLLFWPVHQNLDYDYPVFKSIFEAPVLISFLFLAGILIWSKKMFPKYRLAGFGVFWFFLTLLPESSVVPIKDVIFEHRLYLPMAGYSLFLVSGLFYLCEGRPVRVAVIVLTMIAVCYAVLTFQRNEVWKNDLTLWGDTVRKSPHKTRPLNERGVAFEQNKDYAQALRDLNKALALDPDYADALSNRGLVYYSEGQYDLALLDFNKALTLDPRKEQAYNNRGLTYDAQKQYTKALADFNKAISIDPQFTDPYCGRGVILEKQGRWEEAVADFTRVIQMDPEREKVYYNRALSYTRLGNAAAAVADFSKAIAMDPKDVQAYIDRGLIFAKHGQLPRAFSDFTKAVAADPRSEEAYNNLGIIYSMQGDLLQAVRCFDRAIRLKPGYAESYWNRAVAEYHLKKYPEAWDDVNRAAKAGFKIDPQFISDLKKAS